MNVTFMVGNGFDLGVGLKTRYEDFYDTYINEKSNDACLNAFKTELKEWEESKEKKIIDWADFEKAFGEYSQRFTPNTKLSYIQCFENFVQEFNTYLQKEEEKVQYTDEALIIKTMQNSLMKFRDLRAADKAELVDVINKYSSEREYNFVSFNYTKVLDHCVEVLSSHMPYTSSKVGTMAHIHGYITENMIMGVNDPSQILNKELADDPSIISEIVKPKQNSDARSDYEKTVKRLISNSHIICIYGMSIGATDAKWWKLIAQWLEAHDWARLIILKHDTKYDKRFPFKQNKLIDELVEHFISFSELNDDKKQALRQRIYVGMNKDIFEMNLCKEEKELLTV